MNWRLVQAGDNCAHETAKEPHQESTEALVLCLPGESLDVSYWVHKKRKFRHRGGIEGAVQAMKTSRRMAWGSLNKARERFVYSFTCFHINMW